MTGPECNLNSKQYPCLEYNILPIIGKWYKPKGAV